MTIRVVVADDHQVVRRGLLALLHDEVDITVVGEANNGLEAIDIVRETDPDVVLLDMAMPVMDGISAARVIHHEHPSTYLLLLSSTEDDTALVRAVRAGAIGFIHKSAPVDMVARSIRAAARGEALFSPADCWYASYRTPNTQSI